MKDFETFSAGGKPTVLPIIQIILSRNTQEVERLNVVTKWNIKRVIPMHLDAPLSLQPSEFKEAFTFLNAGTNKVAF